MKIIALAVLWIYAMIAINSETKRNAHYMTNYHPLVAYAMALFIYPATIIRRMQTHAKRK